MQGRANDAILRLLAGWLELAASDLTWLRGGKGSSKVALAIGLSPAEAERRLALACRTTGGRAP